MRQLSTLCFLLLVVLTVSSYAQSPARRISIDELLDRLAERADQFERALPDFIATETLTQDDVKPDGKVVEHSETVSRLTGRQLRIVKDGRINHSFKESRQVLTINGKVAGTDELKSRGAQVGGTFTSLLVAHFSVRDQSDYYFDLQPELTSMRGREAYLITFLSRFDRNEQYYLIENRRLQSQQRGRAWIDTETLTPLRIEYAEVNLPRGIDSIVYVVDYAPVELDRETYMLPIEARTEIAEKDVTSRVICEYRDYKKFSTDVKLND